MDQLKHNTEHPDMVSEQTTINKYSCGCAIVASIISIIFGYDTGVMSGAMIFIKEEMSITEFQVEVLAAILNICALVGSLSAGRVSDWIGRRYTIVLSSIIFLVGSVFMGYSPNYAILLTGRCIAGIGVGYALMIAPVYSAEISSPSYRGVLTSLPELFISLGILTGYISNYFFGKLTLRLGWRLMLGIAAIPSLFLALGIHRMPESPRWLVMQGRLREAKEVLLEICNTKEEAYSRLRDIKVAAGIDENCTDDIVKVSKKSQGEGPRIFKKAGVTTKDKLLLATIGVGITKTLFILVATFLLDKVGRRRLLLTSVGGIIVALATLGSALTIVHHSEEKLLWALALSIASVYTFLAFFSIGLAPITWVYSSEIWPLRLRAQGASMGVAVNRLMNATISISFISLYERITIGGAFFMFTGVAIVAWIFFYFLLPETKGRTLEEIELLFDPKYRSKNIKGSVNVEHQKKPVSSD
ncbi:hypothetical protein IFM89_016220 [Coptis chinensis]|uniref:Major facilitator superfamily (MFS) profile domain-containing protein n=1 Tax=Coptis chinensis TaxID=261450 RepID=A0A835I0F5_9MAGN|nr:hypothetical protein IFM89_016220 [Coptis chinensis]